MFIVIQYHANHWEKYCFNEPHMGTIGNQSIPCKPLGTIAIQLRKTHIFMKNIANHCKGLAVAISRQVHPCTLSALAQRPRNSFQNAPGS